MGFSELNVHLFRTINDLGKQYSMFNPAMIFIAQYAVFVLALAAIAMCFSRDKMNRFIVLSAIATFAISELFGKIAGTFHFNYQPFVELGNVNQLVKKEAGNSFPSDLTMLCFSFGVTFWLFKRGRAFLWVVLAIFVGVARVWVGVHYPGDVLAGAAISVIVAIIVYKVVSQLGVVRKFMPITEGSDGSVLSTTIERKEERAEDF